MAKSVASSLVCPRLDYANFLLLNTTQKNINRLQCIQNTLARVVASHAVPRGTDSFDILQDLHWLPIDQRIEFKLAMSFNILNLLLSACLSRPTFSAQLSQSHTFSAFCQHQSAVSST